MKRALTLATGLTIGYVAGAKAGREKYEQMMAKMHEVSQQPAVAEMRENLQGQVGTATKAVAEKVTDVASGLSKKLHSSSDEDSASSTSSTSSRSSSKNGTKPTPGEYPAAPTGVIPGSSGTAGTGGLSGS